MEIGRYFSARENPSANESVGAGTPKWRSTGGRPEYDPPIHPVAPNK